VSAPGEEHERLLAELHDLAILAGYSQSLALPFGVRPDVARRDTAGRRFVGDAKSTEPPTCAGTFRRLARYARYMAYDPKASDVLALAVPGSADEQAWLSLLVTVVASSGAEVETSSATRLDGRTLVVHVTIRRRPHAARSPVVRNDEPVSLVPLR
jgi:hypothetical protein